MPTPGFLFDPAARRFRDPSGKFVPSRAVRDAVDSLAAGVGGELREISVRLQSGAINAAQWERDCRAIIKAAHVAAGAIAMGGRAQLDPRSMGYIGSQIRAQNTYLRAFGREIEAGLPLDARFLARAAMYGQAARASYENIGRERDIEAGYTQERRRIGGPRPCAGCIAEAAKGWRPAGELLPIGGCECLTRCACTFVRRKSKGTAAMSRIPTPEGVWSPLVAFAKGGSAKPLAKPADAAGGLQGATGATPAGTSTGKPGKGKSKGSSKLHGAGNCGTGKGGFRPGNTCGKSGRARLADDLKAARANADAHGGHSALRDKVKALKMHRRGHEHAVADEHAGQLRAGLRTGKTARNSKIKAETVAHAHAEVKAAHAAQRARNARDAARKPVHEVKREEHPEVKKARELLADSMTAQGRHAALVRDLPAKIAALKANKEELYEKSIKQSSAHRRRQLTKEWEKAVEEHRLARDQHENAKYFQESGNYADRIKDHRDRLDAAIARHGDGGETIDHAAIVANHPDNIAPGNIEDRIAKYKVGDAKIKAIDAIAAHYDRASDAVKVRADKAHKVIMNGMRKQQAIIEGDGDLGSPRIQARMDRIQVRMEAAARVRDRSFEERVRLSRDQRKDVEAVLSVDRPARFEASDIAPGFTTKAGPLSAPGETNRKRIADAHVFLGKTVARGDGDSVRVRIGEGPAYRAHYRGSDDPHIQIRSGEDTSVIVHEYGHAIDHQISIGGRSVNESSQEFLKHRVGDEALVDMHEKFKAGDPGEMGRSDKFHAAMGSDYRAHYTGKYYGSRSTEITSMGLEALHRDPVAFVRADPQFAKHIFGVMDGSLR